VRALMDVDRPSWTPIDDVTASQGSSPCPCPCPRSY